MHLLAFLVVSPEIVARQYVQEADEHDLGQFGIVSKTILILGL